MRARAAVTRFLLIIGIVFAASAAQFATSSPARAEWAVDYGPIESAPTLVEACEATASNLGGTFTSLQRYSWEDHSYGDPEGPPFPKDYLCRIVTGSTSGWAAVWPSCPAGEQINPARATGCQPIEPIVCPTCGGTATSTGGPFSVNGAGMGISSGQGALGNGGKFLAVTDYRSTGTDTLGFTRYYHSRRRDGLSPGPLGWGWPS